MLVASCYVGGTTLSEKNIWVNFKYKNNSLMEDYSGSQLKMSLLKSQHGEQIKIKQNRNHGNAGTCLLHDCAFKSVIPLQCLLK